MGNDIEIIKQIEKQLGRKLKRIPLKEIWKHTNSFSSNKKRNIIGLNLRDANLSDISF